MDHDQATQLTAVEKYLLDEIPQPLREEFEEHFFDCPDCAADLRATAAFLDAAKAELKRGFAPAVARPAASQPAVARPSAWKSRFAFIWKPAFLSPAFALLLMVVVYQNMVVYPRFAGADTQLRNPEILASVSLVGGNSRGGETPSIKVADTQPFLMSVDIPTTDRYSSYSCVLIGPTGSVAWRLPVSAEQAKDTVTIRVPTTSRAPGMYTVLVEGHRDRVPAESTDLARYRFALNKTN